MEVKHHDQKAATTRKASSFGDVLRRERQLREFTLREVAAATKISMRHLEALERNDFSSLPGGVFNRGFLRAYAAFIGLDAEEMINHYLFELSLQRRQPEPEGAQPHGRQRRLVLWLAGGLLLLIVLLWFGWGALAR